MPAVVSVAQATGQALRPGAMLQFLTMPAMISVTGTGQRVFVHAQAVVNANAAATLEIRLCYQPDSAFFPSGSAVALRNLPVAAATPSRMDLSGVISNLGVGSYWVAMCSVTTQPGSFNNGGDSYTSALVLR
jgi:hypothetical protein